MAEAERGGVLDLILTAAAAHAARPALLADGVVRDYDWLLGRASAVAARLALLGDPGDRCAVLGRRSALSYVGFLAALGAGQVYLPLSAQEPAVRQAAKLAQAGARCLVVDRGCLDLVADIVARLSRPPVVLAADSSRSDLLAARLPAVVEALSERDVPATGDVAALSRHRGDVHPPYKLFTTRSTGQPKGVVVPTAAVRNYVVTMRGLLGTVVEDRFSQGFDPGFDLAIHDMLVCWSSGACLVPLSPFKLRYLDDVRQYGITVWFSIPSSISLAARTGQLRPGALPSLRLSLFCGEALMAQDARAWRRAAANGRVYNLYGPTEATIAVSLHDATELDDAAGVVSIGTPFGGNRFLLLDPASDRMAEGAEGELAITGPQLASGYWGDPALTRQRFPTIAGPGGAPVRIYRTGDRARLEKGLYHFLGRIDNEVKIHGYRINPLEVEGALRAAAEGALAVVVQRAPGKLSPIEFVGFVAGSAVAEAEILRRCRESLPNYMWPAEIRRLDELPRLANGKVDRRALAAAAAG